MAMSRQFQLAVELTNLGPLFKYVSNVGHELARRIQDSGSNALIEQSLAEVLGQAQISQDFARSFRAVVKPSKVTPLSFLVDVVIHAGAGPTVQHALQNQEFFSALVQLSFLVSIHQLDHFSIMLAKCLEASAARRGQRMGFDEFQVQGTLGVCQSQTTDFPWERRLKSVELALGMDPNSDAQIEQERPLNEVLLSGLIDGLFAVSKQPETRHLRIRTARAYSTIVIWAHDILGLTVKVDMSARELPSRVFGIGSEHVFIKVDPHNMLNAQHPVITLFNTAESDARFYEFETDSALAMGYCPPSNKIPLEGYSLRILQRLIYPRRLCKPDRVAAIIKDLAHRIIAACIRQRRAFVERNRDNMIPCGSYIAPEAKILEVANVVFHGTQLDITTIDRIIQEPTCIIEADWINMNLPYDLVFWAYSTMFGGMRNVRPGHEFAAQDATPSADLQNSLQALSRLLMAFTWVHDVSATRSMILDIDGWRQGFGKDKKGDVLLTASTAFDAIAWAMHGPSNGNIASQVSLRISATSCYGWTLLLDALAKDSREDLDPSAVNTMLIVRRGTLMGLGVAKDGIIDAIAPTRTQHPLPQGASDRDERIIARPGEKLTMQRRIFGTINAPLIARNSDYPGMIAVAVTIGAGIVDDGEQMQHTTYTGFRDMQERAWNAIRISSCFHADLMAPAVLPADTFAFAEWALDSRVKSGTHLCMTFGEKAARWTQLVDVKSTGFKRVVQKPENPIFLRPRDCCLQCAIEAANSCHKDKIRTVLL